MKKLTLITMALLFTQASFAQDISRNYTTALNSNSDRVAFGLNYPGMNDARTECVYVRPVFADGSIPEPSQFNTAAFSTNFALLDRAQSITPVLSKGVLVYRLVNIYTYLTPISFVTVYSGESFNTLIRWMNHSQKEIKVLLKRGACQ